MRDALTGPITHLVVTTRDIAGRRRRQRDLDHALMRAEEAARAKSEFLANTSHELRTPLNAVLGYTELMTAGIAGPLSPRQTEYIALIHRSGEHLLGLINDILDLAKLDSGRLDMQESGPRRTTSSAAARS